MRHTPLSPKVRKAKIVEVVYLEDFLQKNSVLLIRWSGERKEEGKQALSWKSQRLRASWKISCRTLHRSRLFWSWPLSSEVSPKKKKKKPEFYAKAQCWSSRAWSQGCAATGLLGRIHMENNELVSGSSQRQLSQSELVNKQMGAGGIAPLPL